MPNLITIEDAISNFRKLIEDAIIEGGSDGKNAMIRSSRPILNLHEAVKSELIKLGIDQKLIFPPINQRSPELKLAGARKQKNQDICLISTTNPIEEVLKEGLLDDVIDKYGEHFTERTIAINVRSQISSIQKNFDTLYERTTSESINLHDRCPKMCLGELYMIAIPEYDDKHIQEKEIAFKKLNQQTVLKYIKSFQAINNRKITEKNFYQYERVCLLIVDFTQTPVKIYHSTEELKQDGFIPEEAKIDFSELTWAKFLPSLLQTYTDRFGK